MGLLTGELLRRHLPEERKSCEYFVCGPVPMIDLVEKALHRQGVPLVRIHSEIFALVQNSGGTARSPDSGAESMVGRDKSSLNPWGGRGGFILSRSYPKAELPTIKI